MSNQEAKAGDSKLVHFFKGVRAEFQKILVKKIKMINHLFLLFYKKIKPVIKPVYILINFTAIKL